MLRCTWTLLSNLHIAEKTISEKIRHQYFHNRFVRTNLSQ